MQPSQTSFPLQDFIFVGMNFLTHINRVRVSPQRVSDLLLEGQMGAVPISYHSSRFPLTQRYPELCSRLRCSVDVSSYVSSALSLSSMEMVSRQSC
ncbi:hypothetical protein DPMN_015071 [Dreissena polymorpha]|uniref:Uncharacterized protein n=1 Tax=Dreissena polymorpha TaxID=45954 RepID=A0A9D4NAU2_DREPO|nr:hypothetical protein DPMN_015071 [Dreissena polymorpha]